MTGTMSERILLWAVFISIFCNLHSVLSQSEISRSGKFLEFKIYATRNRKLSIQDILDDKVNFIEPSHYEGKTHPEDYFWIKIDLKEELGNITADSTWYLKTIRFAYASIYQFENGKITERKYGRFENLPKNRSMLSYPGISFEKGSLIQGRYIFLRIKRAVIFDRPARWRFIYRSGFKETLKRDYYSERDIGILQPIYLFSGICLIMFMLTLTYFIYSKRREFLYYSMYVLSLFLYLCADVFRMHEFFFGSYGLLSYTFFFEMQVVINLAYVHFIIRYLDTKSVYPKLHRPLKAISYFLVLVIFLDVLFLATENFAPHIYLLDIERLVMTVFGLLGMIYLLIKARDKLAYFVVIGSLCYTLGALGLLFFSDRLLMITGGSLEIMIFAAGLTYKIQKEYQERLRFETEANKNQRKALRAQINPHFIFNSLTSIQHLVTQDERPITLKYLSRFSRLTRNVLESSMDTNVVLADEIKMLEDYLELESLRFGDSFRYELEVSPLLDTNSVEIPFMLTQPFVENSIIHGLLPKTDNVKELKIKFKEIDGNLVCEIGDNGVGRTAEINQQKGKMKSKKSRGLEITRQRIADMGLEMSPLEVIDKFDKHGNPSGTKVVIYIPIN